MALTISNTIQPFDPHILSELVHSLTVPGLAENRPSIVLGKRFLLRDFHSLLNHCYR
jgi:hypothetical protein